MTAAAGIAVATIAPPIRVLVTGFSVFPGAPFNPTEGLIADLVADKPFDPARIDLTAQVLPVEYARVPELLAGLAASVRPQIAIHFGLAAGARGFRLERIAANECRPSPDASGALPPSASILAGGPTRRSTLPMGTLRTKLEAAGLPLELSRDAGGYLCNYTFYLARSGMVAGYAPAMAGFVHVPYLDSQIERLGPLASVGLVGMTREQLLAGARIIVETCVDALEARLAAKNLSRTAVKQAR